MSGKEEPVKSLALRTFAYVVGAGVRWTIYDQGGYEPLWDVVCSLPDLGSICNNTIQYFGSGMKRRTEPFPLEQRKWRWLETDEPAEGGRQVYLFLTAECDQATSIQFINQLASFCGGQPILPGK